MFGNILQSQSCHTKAFLDIAAQQRTKVHSSFTTSRVFSFSPNHASFSAKKARGIQQENPSCHHRNHHRRKRDTRQGDTGRLMTSAFLGHSKGCTKDKGKKSNNMSPKGFFFLLFEDVCGFILCYCLS